MKIGRKMGLLVTALVTAQVITAAGGGYLLISEGAQFRSMVDEQAVELNTVGELTLERSEQNRAFAELALYGAPVAGESAAAAEQRFDTFLAEYRTRAQQVDTRLADAERLIGDPELAASVAEFGTVQKQSRSVQESRLSSIENGTYDPQVDAETLELNSAGEAVLNGALLDAQNRASVAVAEHTAQSQTLVVLAGLISLMLIGLSVALGALVPRRIVRSIRHLTRSAEEVASVELPGTVAAIRRQHSDVQAQQIAAIDSGTRGDELETLAAALNHLQDSALELAVETRKQEIASNETLVNLGRRNQSLLNRTLSYVSALEQEERDPEVLANLFRLDHLTTRIRRNAESMLVLAGAEQARTQTKPVAIANVVRAALSEIEDYARVTVGEVGDASLFGPHAADVAHLLAELLENATAFSAYDHEVTISGGRTMRGYRMVVRDTGLGMCDEDLAAANELIATAEDSRTSSKVLGLHIVGRLAARRGIVVELRQGEVAGCVAVVDLPAALLVPDEGAREPLASIDDEAAAVAAEPVSVNEEAAEPIATGAVERPVERPDGLQPGVAGTDGVPAPAAPTVAAVEPAGDAGPDEPVVERAPAAPVATPSAAEPVAEPAVAQVVLSEPAEPAPVVAREISLIDPPAPSPSRLPAQRAGQRRVRGAQMPDLGDAEPDEVGPRDAAAVRSQLAALQSSVSRARRDVQL